MGVTNEPDDGTTATPSTHCPDCELLQDRYETAHNRYVLLERGRELLAHTVPASQRWIVQADSWAVSTGNAEPPQGATCRIPHRIVCPCNEPPTSNPTLKALWDYNSGLTAHFSPPEAQAG
ncbi:DUF6083 domain-containing protein [Streptomyces syringium]|uniref:DUF6083 domain-containing protein n=1 Tax=Streptomyces syringium TaxID=76729 RepID=UPI0034531058